MLQYSLHPKTHICIVFAVILSSQWKLSTILLFFHSGLFSEHLFIFLTIHTYKSIQQTLK